MKLTVSDPSRYRSLITQPTIGYGVPLWLASRKAGILAKQPVDCMMIQLGATYQQLSALKPSTNGYITALLLLPRNCTSTYVMARRSGLNTSVNQPIGVRYLIGYLYMIDQQ